MRNFSKESTASSHSWIQFSIPTIHFESLLPRIFQLALMWEFIGHGAFGIIGKTGWLPYFSLFGINERWAWKIMPLVGGLDILLGLMVFFSPRRIVILYMGLWGLFTALLRPLAGEGLWEFFERSYNYGMPLLLFYLVWNGGGKDAGNEAPYKCLNYWLEKISFPALLSGPSEALGKKIINLKFSLRFVMACYLVAHGGIALFMQKDILQQHLSTIGVQSLSGLSILGELEIALGLLVLAVPSSKILWGVFLWKLATESLYVFSGTPGGIWEFIERGGSYAAPLTYLALEKFTPSYT